MIRSLAIISFVILVAISSAQGQTKLRGFMVARGIQPSDIEVLKTWKVNSIRYPLEWLAGVDSANEEEYAEWLEQALLTFDAILPALSEANIKVVLNLYSPPGGFSNNPACSSSQKLFCNGWTQSAFIEAWQKIATRYKDNATIYGFDLVNEPAFRKAAPGLMDWNTLAIEATKAIRQIDPTRHVIIEPPFGDLFRMNQIKPVPFQNISYSPHFYYPLSFQHQGLYGRKLGVKYPNKNFNKKLLAEKLARVVAFQKKNKGARIYFGEFSAVRWAPGNSAFQYLKDLISIFEKRGWDWSYHAFRESDAWSLEHDGNIKNKAPATKTTARLKLMQGFFNKNKFPP